MTAHQIKEGKFDKVILAIGSCEAHGQHLAEGCDTIVSYELSKQVADRVRECWFSRRLLWATADIMTHSRLP